MTEPKRAGPRKPAAELPLRKLVMDWLKDGACCLPIGACADIEVGRGHAMGIVVGPYEPRCEVLPTDRAWSYIWTTYVPHLADCCNRCHRIPVLEQSLFDSGSGPIHEFKVSLLTHIEAEWRKSNGLRAGKHNPLPTKPTDGPIGS